MLFQIWAVSEAVAQTNTKKATNFGLSVLGYSLFCDRCQDGVSFHDIFERWNLIDKIYVYSSFKQFCSFVFEFLVP